MQIGFGGGCHWCTEAVFQPLKGVDKVGQGWIASINPYDDFSEAVLVTFDPEVISLQDLIEIHLHTHSSTNAHVMRRKYRSAVYYQEKADQTLAEAAINELQKDFDKKLITKILPLYAFKPSPPKYRNYYLGNPEKPFCETYISPKLTLLRKKFKVKVDVERLI